MKLMIDVPHGWATTCAQDWSTSISPDNALQLIVAPLVERARANLQAVLGRNLPKGARVEELSRVWTRSYAGWEMAAIMARAFDASGREIERRRVALYQVYGFVGAVMVVGTPPRAFERQAEKIDCMLRSGRPHSWTRQPATTEWLPQTA
jgi:hypothetical protein